MNEDHKLKVVKVRLVPDIPLYSDKFVVNSKDAVEILRKELSTYDREVFGILNLNTKGQPINFNIASMGTIDSTAVHPREVFKPAILSNATAFIGLHNHPSGSIKPSKNDIIVTQRLYEAGKLIGIEMLDHIIAGNDKIYSFAEHNLLGRSVDQAIIMSQMDEDKNSYRSKTCVFDF